MAARCEECRREDAVYRYNVYRVINGEPKNQRLGVALGANCRKNFEIAGYTVNQISLVDVPKTRKAESVAVPQALRATGDDVMELRPELFD